MNYSYHLGCRSELNPLSNFWGPPQSFGGKEGRTQAIADYRAAIAKDPDNLENYYYLLMILGMEQQQDEVQASLAAAKASLVKRGKYGHAAVLDDSFKHMKTIRFF